MNKLRFIRPIFRGGSNPDRIICLLTYVPLRLIRGFLYKVAGKIYKTKGMFGGEKIGRLLSRLRIGGLPLFMKLPDGNTVILPATYMASFGVISSDVYDDEVYEKFYTLKEGDVMVDVGAHVGFFVLKSCRLQKQGVIIVIEPDPQNFKLLIRNIRLNGFRGKVVQINAALGKQDRKAKFYASDYFSAGSRLRYRKFAKRIDVKILRIDTLIDKLNIKRIDFLKMDAEGAELEIFEGANGCLEKRTVRNAAIAAYHLPIHQRKQLAKMLKSHRYNVVLTKTGYIYAHMNC